MPWPKDRGRKANYSADATFGKGGRTGGPTNQTPNPAARMLRNAGLNLALSAGIENIEHRAIGACALAAASHACRPRRPRALSFSAIRRDDIHALPRRTFFSFAPRLIFGAQIFSECCGRQDQNDDGKYADQTHAPRHRGRHTAHHGQPRFASRRNRSRNCRRFEAAGATGARDSPAAIIGIWVRPDNATWILCSDSSKVAHSPVPGRMRTRNSHCFAGKRSCFVRFA